VHKRQSKQRQTRHPLELELLEPRVYLSGIQGGNEPQTLWRAEVAALADRLAASNINLHSGQPVLVVIDVNGPTNSNNAIVATFDPATGELIGTVEVTGGEIILTTDAPSKNPDIKTGTNESPAPGGGTSPIVAAPSATDPQQPSQTTRPPRPSSARPPVVVVFTNGTIPETFNPPLITGSGGQQPPANETPAPSLPLIVVPSFPRWLTMLSVSPWWTRATERDGLQSRDGVMDAQLWDDTIGGRSRQLSEDLPYGPSSQSVMSSRVFLQSPVRSIIFTSPRAATDAGAQPGAELAVYNLETGQLRHTGHAVTGRLVRAGSRVAFLSPGWEQPLEFLDDGVLNTAVLHVFDPVTGGVRNTGISAETIRSENDQIILGIRNAAQQSSDSPLNPGVRLLAYRFDPGTGRLIDLHAAFETAVTPVITSQTAPPNSDRPTLLEPNAARIDLQSAWPFAAVHTMAPLDSGAALKANIGGEQSARPAPGSPSGPPKPGGSSGVSPSSNSTVSSTSASSATSSGSSAAAGG
jgi:hypothetical protein